MPYSSLDQLPKSVKNLSKSAQAIYMKAFNESYEDNKDKATAFKAAATAASEATLPAEDAGLRGRVKLYTTTEEQMNITEQAYIYQENDIFKVKLIQTGVSMNKNNWTPEVLEKAAPLFEGALSYDGHSDEDRKPSELYGKFKNVTYKENALHAEFILTPQAEWLKDAYKKGFTVEQLGLSVHVHAKTHNEEGINYIEEVVGGPDDGKPRVDVVLFPSAGGELKEMKKNLKGGTMVNEEMLELKNSYDLLTKELEEKASALKKATEEIENMKAAQKIADLLNGSGLNENTLELLTKKLENVYDIDVVANEIAFCIELEKSFNEKKVEPKEEKKVEEKKEKPIVEKEKKKTVAESNASDPLKKVLKEDTSYFNDVDNIFKLKEK